jgi:CBS domain containing-hemolysin-like protein
METDFMSVRAESHLAEFARIASENPRAIVFVIWEGNHIVGYARRQSALDAFPDHTHTARVAEIARQDYIILNESARFSDIVGALRTRKASVALVSNGESPLRADGIKGVITKEQVADAVLDAADFFYD